MTAYEWRHAWALALLAVPIGLALVVNSGIIQFALLSKRDAALDSRPEIAHALEYLSRPFDPAGERLALAYAGVMKAMALSADAIPQDAVAASVKHENYAVITDRKAVNLSGIVSPQQQLCNLRRADVHAVFLSRLTTRYNPRGMDLLEPLREVSSGGRYLELPGTDVDAWLLFIDPRKLRERLAEGGADCRAFRHAPDP